MTKCSLNHILTALSKKCPVHRELFNFLFVPLSFIYIPYIGVYTYIYGRSAGTCYLSKGISWDFNSLLSQEPEGMKYRYKEFSGFSLVFNKSLIQFSME